MPGITVRELVTVFGFKTNTGELEAVENKIFNLKKALIATVAAGTAAAASIFGLAQNVASNADEIAKSAAVTGLNGEQLQAWRYAGKLAGVQQAALTMGFQRLTRRSAEAAKGMGEAKDTLKELGIQLIGSDGRLRSTNDLLLDIADAMARIPDENERVRVAFKLFDSEGVRLVNLFKDGSGAIRETQEELARMGGILSLKELRTAEEYANAVTRFGASLAGIKNTVGVGLLPALQAIIDELREWIVANSVLVRTRVRDFLKGLLAFMVPFLKVATGLVDALFRIIEQLGGFERMAKLAGIAVSVLLALRFTQTVMDWAEAASNFAQALRYTTSMVYSLLATEGSLVTFKAVWQTLGNTALVAWLKTLGPIALVAVAIGAVVLIVQDLITWFRGGESALTHLLGTVEEFGWKEIAVIKTIWAFLVAFFGDQFRIIKGFFVNLWAIITGAFDRFLEIRDRINQAFEQLFEDVVNLAIAGVNGIIEALNRIPGVEIPLIPKFDNKGIQLGGIDATAPVTNPLSGLFPLDLSGFQNSGLPEDLPLRIADTGRSRTEQNINIDSTVNVTVPEGTQEEQARWIRETVDKANEEGLARMLQHASANFAVTG